MTGSKYFMTVADQLYDNVISLEDLNDFSDEITQELAKFVNK
jgi:hypothetical protein